MRDPGRAQPRRDCVPGRGSRILCEQVHQAAEFSIEAVITANGHSFVTRHDLEELLETARDAGDRIPEGIPAGIEKVRGTVHLCRTRDATTSTDPGLAWVGEDEYDDAVDAAAATVEWARERVETILSGNRKRPRRKPRTEIAPEEPAASPRLQPDTLRSPPRPKPAGSKKADWQDNPGDDSDAGTGTVTTSRHGKRGRRARITWIRRTGERLPDRELAAHQRLTNVPGRQRGPVRPVQRTRPGAAA